METLTAACPGNAEPVRDRVREVLDAVFAPRDAWPSLDDWRGLLPAWFVEACSDDVTVVNCVVDRWSLRAWIYWFQPDQRRWTLHGLRAEGDRLLIEIEPTGRGSLLLGSLEWLVKVAGGRLLSPPAQESS